VILDRREGVENYAYPFIHTDDIKTWITEKFGGDMQFDVVIGNPPYQMKGGSGGTNDSPIYHLFVEQAKRLEPKFLSMVVPSRWLAGGRGLEEFRKEMLGSHELVGLVDYSVSSEVFPGVQVEGGVCYFLWEASYDGPCQVTVVRGNDRQTSTRQLDQFDVFVRDPRAVEILQKVLRANEASITEILTADTPFGLATNFDEFHAKKGEKGIALYYVRGGKRSVGYVRRDLVTKNTELIKKWKVLVPKAHGGGQVTPSSVLGKPLLCAPPSVCTQTFLAFTVESRVEAESLESYYRTKLFRFLVSLRKITQDALRSTYTWVPQQTWDRMWTDKELYKKYKLTKEEIEFIESMIRPMEASDE
jgi:site-specific DNA-methyltransferase (adenine-specific)